MQRFTVGQAQQFVAANVRRLRTARGMTQEGLAEVTGFALRYVQEVESALKAVSLPSLVALANALGVAPADLLQPAEMHAIKRGRPRKAAAGTEEAGAEDDAAAGPGGAGSSEEAGGAAAEPAERAGKASSKAPRKAPSKGTRATRKR